MNEEEMRALIELVETELAESALSQLVGPSTYLDLRDGPELTGDEDDTWQSRDYLLGLLEAFDRHLAVSSDDTCREAIHLINQNQQGDPVKDIAVLTPDLDGDLDHVQLVGLQDVQPIRNRLAEVIEYVRGADPRPSPRRSF